MAKSPNVTGALDLDFPRAAGILSSPLRGRVWRGAACWGGGVDTGAGRGEARDAGHHSEGGPSVAESPPPVLSNAHATSHI